MQYRKTTPVPALCALLALVSACLISPTLAKADVDLSSPKKAALAFFKAVEAGDEQAMKASSIGSDDDYAALKLLSHMLDSMKKMQAALVKKYGDPAKEIPDLSAVMSAQVDQAEEKVDGDSATLIDKNKPDDKYPPTLKKSGTEWKMDLKAMSADPNFAKMKERAPKAAVLLDDFTKDVESGKYATYEDAKMALSQTMKQLNS